MPEAHFLGRLHLSAGLDRDEVALVHELTHSWEVAGSRGLVPTGRSPTGEAAEALRGLVRDVLKPLDIRVHGAVVVEDDDGGLAMVTSRNGRVTTRRLWEDGWSAESPRRCGVIDLAVHRAERRQVRP